MYMVWHHYPRAKLIELPLVLSDRNGMSNDIGNLRMPEPKRPRGVLIQRAVLRPQTRARDWDSYWSRQGEAGSPTSAK
jgi:hypothetical protein